MSEQQKNTGITKKKWVIYILLGLISCIGIIAFTKYQAQEEIKSYEIELQFLEQQKAETEKRIEELNNQLLIAYQNLEQAKRNLHDASAFKLLRSNRKRHVDITNAEASIKTFEKEIKGIEDEMSAINPGWKKNN